MKPRLAVVIVNFNARAWLEQCLRSVCNQEIVEELEIVVVDSASTDDSAEMVRHEFPCCKLISAAENLGFGRGNNLGVAQSSAPILLFLNPDTEVEAGALAELLAFMEQNPQYGAAGGQIYDADGQIERSAGTWPTLSSLALDRVLERWPGLRSSLEKRAHHHWDYRQEREVGWVTGAYLWIRREVFDRLGGFDRDFFMYYEDVDLCYRIWADGSRICFFPGASIIHYRNKAPVQDRRRKSMMRFAMRQFMLKHYTGAGRGATRLTTQLLYRFGLF